MQHFGSTGVNICLYFLHRCRERFSILRYLGKSFEGLKPKEKEDFFWIRRDIKTGSLNLLLYNLPIQNFESTDVFSDHVIRKRDSIAKEFVPGPLKGNYMTTETAYMPFFVLRNMSNVTTLETRSLWKIEGAFMSGPFVNFCFVDKTNRRLFVAEGFVYAPSENKRDYMFELETIMRSISVQ